jgi:hypothetical protein
MSLGAVVAAAAAVALVVVVVVVVAVAAAAAVQANQARPPVRWGSQQYRRDRPGARALQRSTRRLLLVSSHHPSRTQARTRTAITSVPHYRVNIDARAPVEMHRV